jgi:hypothetical protein
VLRGEAPVDSLLAVGAAAHTGGRASRSKAGSRGSPGKRSGGGGRRGRTGGLRTPSPAATWSRRLVDVEMRRELRRDVEALDWRQRANAALREGDTQSWGGGGSGGDSGGDDSRSHSSSDSDDSMLDMNGLISRTGLSDTRTVGLSRLTPEQKGEVRDLESALDEHPKKSFAKMMAVTVCMVALLGVPLTLMVLGFADGV